MSLRTRSEIADVPSIKGEKSDWIIAHEQESIANVSMYPLQAVQMNLSMYPLEALPFIFKKTGVVGLSRWIGKRTEKVGTVKCNISNSSSVWKSICHIILLYKFPGNTTYHTEVMHHRDPAQTRLKHTVSARGYARWHVRIVAGWQWAISAISWLMFDCAGDTVHRKGWMRNNSKRKRGRWKGIFFFLKREGR